MISTQEQTKQQTTTMISAEVQQIDSSSSKKKKSKKSKPQIDRSIDDSEAFSFEKFDVTAELDDFLAGKNSENSKISLRLTQRGARKTITSIIGIDEKSIKNLSKSLKKSLHCRGSISEDENYGTVIDLTGDQRAEVVKYLIEHDICRVEDIVI